MITVAICDDEMQFRRNLRQACHQYFEERNLKYVIEEYKSGEDFLMGNYPDILLLDINMHRINGFIIREILAKKHADTRILFVAESKNFITEAFGRNVFGYLVKPLRYQMFCNKMDIVVKDVKESKQFIYCKQGKEIDKVYLNGILYMESYGRYTKIYLHGDNECRISEKGIRQWGKELEKTSFAKCNSKQVVNLNFITSIQEDIKLINGKSITITQTFKNEFWTKYKQWKG